MNKREFNKEVIRKAVRRAIKSLMDSGVKITQSEVIRNSFHENGKLIGKTTLYSKNNKTEKFVYQDLLSEIEIAIDTQNKKIGRKSKKVTLVGMKEKNKKLNLENNKLIDQVVTQQEMMRILKLGDSSVTNQIRYLEDEVFILGSLLNESINGAIPDLKKGLLKYMELHANSDRLKFSTNEIEIKQNLINESKVIIGSLKKV